MSSIWLGSRDLDEEGEISFITSANGKRRVKNSGWSWNNGIKVSDSLTSSAKLTMVTAITYFIIQIPAFMYMNLSAEEKAEKEHIPALVGLIVSLLAFATYSIIQLKDSAAAENQERKQKEATIHAWKQNIQKRFTQSEDIFRLIFDKFDSNSNGVVSLDEFYEGLQVLGLPLERKELLNFMAEFDVDSDNELSFLEFRHFAEKVFVYKNKSIHSLSPIAGDIQGDFNADDETTNLIPKKPSMSNYKTMSNLAVEVDTAFEKRKDDGEIQISDEEDLFLDKSNNQILWEAIKLLLAGTVLVTVFSDPMCNAISAFSVTTGIPAFYVSFILTPLASNASEVLASLRFAKKKTVNGCSLSISSLYGAACMNNTFCLAIFFALIYFQGLRWTFSVETIVILLTELVLGIIGLRNYYRNWQGIIIGSLYFISLLICAFAGSYLDV